MNKYDIGIIGCVIVLALSVGCIGYGLNEMYAPAEPIEEDYEIPFPYIIDEQGRFRIVATTTVVLNINVASVPSDPDYDDSVNNPDES